jgi:hypothetical protein
MQLGLTAIWADDDEEEEEEEERVATIGPAGSKLRGATHPLIRKTRTLPTLWSKLT